MYKYKEIILKVHSPLICIRGCSRSTREYIPFGVYVLHQLHSCDQTGEVQSTKEQLSMKKIRESVKLKESAENIVNGPPADSMILTCSTWHRQELELA